jgi:hypothetical protein
VLFIIINKDQAVFKSDDNFKFLSLLCNETQVYQTDANLPVSINSDNGAVYPLPEIILDGLGVYQNVCHFLSTKRETINETKFSGELQNSVTVPGVGEFLRFKDGRVRVFFTDRTILEINVRDRIAMVFDKYGETVRVRLDKIVVYQSYISKALDFLNWCTSKPSLKPIDIPNILLRNSKYLTGGQ